MKTPHKAQQASSDALSAGSSTSDHLRPRPGSCRRHTREIEPFLLELGAGFAFLERQKRITLDGDDYYIDLLSSTGVCEG